MTILKILHTNFKTILNFNILISFMDSIQSYIMHYIYLIFIFNLIMDYLSLL